MRHTLIMLLLVIGCTPATEPAPTAPAVVGTWTVRSINDSTLPYVWAETLTDTHRIKAESLVFHPTGTFRQVSVSGVLSHPTMFEVIESTATRTGSYSVAGDTVTLSMTGGVVWSGTRSGNRLTMVKMGRAFAYEHQ